MQAIDTIIKEGPDACLLIFQATPYKHPQNGQTYRYYEMTRDGFVELVMGFTGAKAQNVHMHTSTTCTFWGLASEPEVSIFKVYPEGVFCLIGGTTCEARHFIDAALTHGRDDGFIYGLGIPKDRVWVLSVV